MTPSQANVKSRTFWTTHVRKLPDQVSLSLPKLAWLVCYENARHKCWKGNLIFWCICQFISPTPRLPSRRTMQWDMNQLILLKCTSGRSNNSRPADHLTKSYPKRSQYHADCFALSVRVHDGVPEAAKASKVVTHGISLPPNMSRKRLTGWTAQREKQFPPMFVS